MTRTSVFLFSETNNDDNCYSNKNKINTNNNNNNNNNDDNVWLLKYVKMRYYNAYYFLFIIIYKNILFIPFFITLSHKFQLKEYAFRNKDNLYKRMYK